MGGCRCNPGYLATVVLLVTPLAKLEKDLSGLCRLADSFGLLDEAKPRRWLQSVDSTAHATKPLHPVLRLSMALVRFMALLIAAYFMCQYLLRYGPSDLQASLPNHFRNFLALRNTESIMETTSWWRAVCLAAPYAVLVIVFAHDLARTRPRSSKLKLSQILYERYFGIAGLHYDLKVATLQALTVLLQALGKLHLLGGVTIFAVQQDSRATWALKSIFWTFWLLLLFNSLYPTALLISPKIYGRRYMSAFLDVCLDLGYVLTYLLLIAIGMTELHLEVSVSGNFGRIQRLNFSNRTLVKNCLASPSWNCVWTCLGLYFSACVVVFMWRLVHGRDAAGCGWGGVGGILPFLELTPLTYNSSPGYYSVFLHFTVPEIPCCEKSQKLPKAA